MRIGILKTDSVRSEFQPRHGDYPDMFRRVLSAASSEPLAYTTYDVEHGAYPARFDACDGYVITGSRRSAYEDEPWIVRFAQWLRDAIAARVPLVGICFGHQLIAHALDGEAGPAAVGWGVGRKDVQWLVHEPWMEGVFDAGAASRAAGGTGAPPPPPATSDAGARPGAAATLGLLASHKDQVTRLPSGARLLATADYCPIAAYAIDDHVLAIQGHPEFNAAYARDLLDFRRELLGEPTWSTAVRSLDQAIDSERVAALMVRFIAAARQRRQPATPSPAPPTGAGS